MQPSLPTLVGNQSVTIKPKYKIDLSTEYGLHRNTITDMCKTIGIEGSKRLTIKQVVAFYNHYGYPGNYQVVMNGTKE